MMTYRKYYPTIVLSDIHWGSEHSRTEEATRFCAFFEFDDWETLTYDALSVYAEAV